MRPIVIAILMLALAVSAGAADRATMPDNPNATSQPNGLDPAQVGSFTVDTQRDVTVYDDPDAFLGILAPGFYFEDFSAYGWGDISEVIYSFGPVNGYSYLAICDGQLYSVPGALSTNSAFDPMTIEFDGLPVTAVGGDFFTTDFDGAPNAFPITVTLDDGTSVTLEYPTVFAGFTSTVPIASITLTTPDQGTNAWVTLDNFYVGEVGAVAVEGVTLSQVKALF
jgi:hypothetical protein